MSWPTDARARHRDGRRPPLDDLYVIPANQQAHGLDALYARRRDIELDLRNLKTTTGMDVLICQTPQMNEKQLWVHLLPTT